MKNSKTWISQVIQMLGPHKTSTEIPDKIAYSRDMWPKALLWQRKGDYPFHPDLVVWPENEDEVCKILEFCHSHEIPIVPWGGGSGVCGGAIPVRGGLVMDLKRMNKILHIDRKSLLVRSQTGIMGEILERSLNQEGLTLGHFPSSIYCSTLGGWLATRAAGQLSSLYGKIEDMVSSLRIALPSGRILETPSGPKSSTGPDFNQLFLGTEGTLGIFTQAELKVHPLPEHRAFLSGTFSNLENGLEGIRLLMQNGLRPAALRLYDGLDTLLA
ncbi:MAG: FAD-binding oxidoreductase, partial [Planctomycetota bacterium]